MADRGYEFYLRVLIKYWKVKFVFPRGHVISSISFYGRNLTLIDLSGCNFSYERLVSKETVVLRRH